MQKKTKDVRKSKRMRESLSKIDKTRSYALDEAINLLKETGKLNFDSTVEAHFKMGIDTRKSDQQIRATITLPHGTGKTKRIAAFVSSNDETVARNAGADIVCGEEEIKVIKDTGKIDFDVAVATPEMMPKLAVIAKILGPRGIMPNPKTDTVGADIAKIVGALKKGKVSFKNDDTGNIHMAIGKLSFDNSKLKENFNTFVETLRKVKPTGSKGSYIKVAYLATTMGPSVKIVTE